MFKITTIWTLSLLSLSSLAIDPGRKPNIIILFADDISARELPVYGSSVWSPPEGGNTSDTAFRARTPVLDSLAANGCWVKSAWAATVCSPSRAMMMTGRYAHLHKWWHNSDYGRDRYGKVWPLYESSPHTLAHVASEGGYATFWAGKTQMKGTNVLRFGFDEGLLNPGEAGAETNPYTDFRLATVNVDGKKVVVSMDTGKEADSYAQSGWYWKPHIRLMNHPSATSSLEWWPNTPEARDTFGLHTYGPDMEMHFILDFMDRKHAEGKPFFIYHTSHLGHDGWDFFDPESTSKWPGTPKISWSGDSGYFRTAPFVTGDNGTYDTHGTVTGPGIHHHINYLDYQVWLYLNKLREMGEEDNTVFIFCADNGTVRYGKGSEVSQKGTHVPLIIYAPGMGFTKMGEQDIEVSLADILPTVAEIAGVSIPESYEINGESLWPYLTGVKMVHRDWVYAYKSDKQLIRGHSVLRDGQGNWFDVASDPEDLISFPKIFSWSSMPESQQEERAELMARLPSFDTYHSEHDPDDGGGAVHADPLGDVVYATALGFTEDTIHVTEGSTLKIILVTQPENASYRQCLWTTADSSVAIVDHHGVVRGISVGTTHVTALEYRSLVTAQVILAVDPYVPVSVSGVDVTPDSVILDPGEIVTLQAEIFPVEADDKEVTWSAADPFIATVTTKGIVKAGNPGTTSVVATTRDGRYRDSCVVTVTDPFVTARWSSGSLNGSRNSILYPNPVGDLFSVTGVRGIRGVQIYSLQGVLMKSITGPPTSGIPVADLIPGSYFCSMLTDTGIITGTILKE